MYLRTCELPIVVHVRVRTKCAVPTPEYRIREFSSPKQTPIDRMRLLKTARRDDGTWNANETPANVQRGGAGAEKTKIYSLIKYVPR